MADITIPIATNLDKPPLELGTFISNIVGVVLIIAAIAAFVFMVWAGVQWITAGGDKGKVEEARNRITGAVIGLVIVAVSWAVFLLVDYFLGLGIASGASTGGSGGGGGGTTIGCPCNNGLCAYYPQFGSMGGTCYQCQESGRWIPASPAPSSCPPITCQACQ